MTDSKVQTSDAAVQVPAQPVDKVTLVDFAKSLAPVLPRESQTLIRFAEKGLFISEQVLEDVVAAYGKWFTATTGIGRELTREKIFKKLFDSETPELYYLIDGKACLVGFLAPGTGVSAVRSDIPSCIGSLQPTKDILHPRDPILQQIDGIHSNLGPEGLKIELVVGEKRILVSREAFEAFAKIYERTYWLQRMSPRKGASRREALKVLLKCVRRSRPRGKKRGLFIPAKYRGGANIEFIGVASLVFVIEGGTRIAFVYDLRRPNFTSFARDELVALSAGLKNTRLGALEIRPVPGRLPEISIKAEGERFGVDVRAFEPIALACQNDPRTEPKLFTLFDLVRSFARLYEKSGWVAPHAVPKSLQKQFEKYPRPRSTQGWFFFLDQRNEVQISTRLRDAPDYQIMQKMAPPPQGGGGNRDRRRHNDRHGGGGRGQGGRGPRRDGGGRGRGGGDRRPNRGGSQGRPGGGAGGTGK